MITMSTPELTSHTGYAKGRARREAIVAVASQRFSQVGFRNASMVEIAAICGISRAGLLHHFPTKELLLEAVLEARDTDDHARFRANGSQSEDPLAILRGMVDLARHNRTVPGLIELFVMLSAEATTADHPAHDYFVKRNARIRAGTARALRRAAVAGHLKGGIDPDEFALELTALMDGLQVQWLYDPTIDMSSILAKRIESALTTPL